MSTLINVQYVWMLMSNLTKGNYKSPTKNKMLPVEEENKGFEKHVLENIGASIAYVRGGKNFESNE